MTLTSYVNADLAGNVGIRRSTIGMSILQEVLNKLGFSIVEDSCSLHKKQNMLLLQKPIRRWFGSRVSWRNQTRNKNNNILYCNSQNAIHLAKNPSVYSKTKHIQLGYHFIWSLLKNEILKLEKISEAQSLADMSKRQ